MKALLAEQLLAEVTGIKDLTRLSDVTQRLRTLADIKYDDYGGYTPGVRFIESLAVWLSEFNPSDRETALDFVLHRLAYISATELDHLVSTVYKDMLRPRLLRIAANMLGEPSWAVRKIASSPEFLALQRQTLVLGMSDGARLDKLRRASLLSTEQFHLVSTVDKEKADDMSSKLAAALTSMGWLGEAKFSSVIVVDDFSGSGMTMLRPGVDGWKGKLPKIISHVADLKSRGVVADDARVIVLLYLLTKQAKSQLTARMNEAGFTEPEVSLIAAHTFDDDFPLTEDADKEFWKLCSDYFRESWDNEHSGLGGDLSHGFGGSALPLVIHHNAPNNSPPILWKDESIESSGNSDSARQWIGVFPRHERHHPGRP
ncbi:phosphoribosyltransferase-like protein [Pseudarthrobacter sp. MDT1-22]